MMGGAGGIRKIYSYAALVAFLHVTAAVVVLAYATATGSLTVEKLRAMTAALQNKPPQQLETVAASSAESTKKESTETAKAQPDGSASVMQTDLDIIRLEAERIKAELDQRLALNNSILLKVASEREAFQRERQAAMDREKTGKSDDRGEGFAKQVAIFETLTPKVAVDHLLSMGDTDDAARVLVALDSRKAKAIIEAAKRDDQTKKMKEILRRVREVAPAESSRMNAGAENQK